MARVQRIVTDESWRATTGEIQSADLYDGSAHRPALEHRGWRRAGLRRSALGAAAVVPFDPRVIEPRMAPPVRRSTRSSPARTRPAAMAASSSTAARTSRVRSGCVSRARRGDRVTVRHAEVREPDGSLHTRSLRSAKATDTYILADDARDRARAGVHVPRLPVRGGRDRRRGPGRASSSPSAATPPAAGAFACSDARLKRLHENVVWSQRDNFVSVPTDCPQRDERLGWTGDAQAFAPTASTLFDSQAFWASWLRDLALEQDDVLGVPSVVPDVVLGGRGHVRPGRLGGRGDHGAVGGVRVVRRPSILSDQLDSMRRWVASLRRAARAGRPARPEHASSGTGSTPTRRRTGRGRPRPTRLPRQRVLRPQRPARGAMRRGSSATRSLGADACARRRVGRADMGALGRARHHDPDRLRRGARVRHRPGRRARRRSATRSRGWSATRTGRVATGFLGTPLILPALADAGHFDEAYLMLLRRELPSWLYQVDQGATTVWERWDAIRPDGSIHPGRHGRRAERCRERARSRTCSRSTTTPTARSSTGSIATSPASRPTGAPGYRRSLRAPAGMRHRLGAASVESPYGGRHRLAHRRGRNACGGRRAAIRHDGIFSGALTDRSQVTTDERGIDR